MKKSILNISQNIQKLSVTHFASEKPKTKTQKARNSTWPLLFPPQHFRGPVFKHEHLPSIWAGVINPGYTESSFRSIS